MGGLPRVEQGIRCVGSSRQLFTRCVDYRSIDSDIIYVNALGTSILVLNSLSAAEDLLDKRSGVYSSRYVEELKQFEIILT